MSLTIADLFVSDETPMNADFFNNRFQLIVNEIANAEAMASTYGTVSTELLNLGLQRIDQTLTPFLAEIQAAATVGFLVAPSGTSATVTNGVQSTFTIPMTNAAVFQPTPWLTIQDASNAAHWALGQNAGWDATTGIIQIGVTYTSTGGTLTGSNWLIAAGSAVLPAAVTAESAAASSASAAASSATTAAGSATAAAASAATAASDLTAIQAALTSGPVLSVAGLSGTVAASALVSALALTAANVSGVMPKTGGAFTGSIGFAPGVTASSAATVDLGSLTSNVVTITGTTTITSFGGTAASGYTYLIGFSGALQLTNSGSLVLPGGANITTAAGDTCIAIKGATGSNWTVVSYQRASGLALVQPTLTVGNMPADVLLASPQFIVSGGGSAIQTGLAPGSLQFTFPCTINSVTLLADKSESTVKIDIWKCTYSQYAPGTHPVVGDSICASAVPGITSGAKFTDSTLTGWTKTIAAGDILSFNCKVAASAATTITVILSVTKT